MTGVCVRVDYYENFEITGAATPTATKEVCAEAGASPDGGVPRLDGGTDAPTATDGGIDVPSDTEETADGAEVIDG
jgi:hypothetical protein